MGPFRDRPIRAVIADDQEDIRFLLETLMSTVADVEIVGSAATGQEAIDLVSLTEPDCVVLDIMMPGMDGLECARRIRELRPDQRLVFCSAHIAELELLGEVDLSDEVWIAKDDLLDLPELVTSIVAA